MWVCMTPHVEEGMDTRREQQASARRVTGLSDAVVLKHAERECRGEEASVQEGRRGLNIKTRKITLCSFFFFLLSKALLLKIWI